MDKGVTQRVVLNGFKYALHRRQEFHAEPRYPLLVPRVRFDQILLGLWSQDQFHTIIRD